MAYSARLGCSVWRDAGCVGTQALWLAGWPVSLPPGCLLLPPTVPLSLPRRCCCCLVEFKVTSGFPSLKSSTKKPCVDNDRTQAHDAVLTCAFSLLLLCPFRPISNPHHIFDFYHLAHTNTAYLTTLPTHRQKWLTSLFRSVSLPPSPALASARVSSAWASRDEKDQDKQLARQKTNFVGGWSLVARLRGGG